MLTAAHPKASEESNLPQLDQVFQVTVRTTDHQGVPYLVPDVEVDVYWTNLYEDPETIIGLYHDHGTSELNNQLRRLFLGVCIANSKFQQ